MYKVNITNIIIADVHSWDYPDFCDAYIQSAEINGRPAAVLNKDGDK